MEVVKSIVKAEQRTIKMFLCIVPFPLGNQLLNIELRVFRVGDDC